MNCGDLVKTNKQLSINNMKGLQNNNINGVCLQCKNKS